MGVGRGALRHRAAGHLALSPAARTPGRELAPRGTLRDDAAVNLAPLDARFLYGWTAPRVPDGWSEVRGHTRRGGDGTVLRIRNRSDDAPGWYD